MNKHKFRLKTDESLIVVECQVEEDNFSVALDTGASHTVMDLNVMLMLGFQLKDAMRTVEFQTSKGVIEAFVFKTPFFSALGLEKKDMEICAYDFLGSGVVSDFDGVLGLDFFKKTDLFISFKRFEIILS